MAARGSQQLEELGYISHECDKTESPLTLCMLGSCSLLRLAAGEESLFSGESKAEGFGLQIG